MQMKTNVPAVDRNGHINDNVTIKYCRKNIPEDAFLIKLFNKIVGTN